MKTKLPATSERPTPDRASYDKESTPFDQVLRKLVSVRPPHKATKPAAPKAGKATAKQRP